MTKRMGIWAMATAVIALVGGGPAQAAEDAAAFYKSHNIDLIVGAGAGGN